MVSKLYHLLSNIRLYYICHVQSQMSTSFTHYLKPLRVDIQIPHLNYSPPEKPISVITDLVLPTLLSSKFHPGSGSWLFTHPGFRIPDPGVKKAPDPGSGSATLHFRHADRGLEWRCFLAALPGVLPYPTEKPGNVPNIIVMDQDTEPVGSETIGKMQIRIRKYYFGSWIRPAPDPKWLWNSL